MKLEKLISVRIDLICSNGKKATIGMFYTPQVPAPGELLNWDGNPFMVQCRKWAAGVGDKRVYSYLEVVKFGEFTLGTLPEGWE